MNQAAFIIAAYVLTVAGLVGLLVHSWLAMRGAERAADEMRKR